MNLNKHDPQTDMEMDMTPMIDVVFLLIIFFMVITDMTQADLEELKLPMAMNATEDKPDPEEIRPVVNILQDGSIIIKRELKYDPENPDGYAEVKAYLSLMAGRMEKEYFNPETKSGPQIPDDPLLIRADEFTPFKYVQKVMEFCGLKDIQIWKVQFAATEDEDKEEGDA